MKATTTFKLRDFFEPLSKPGTLLAALYAIAICFERSVQVEIFKPYRVIGAALILLVLVRGRICINRFAILAMSFVLTGVILALVSSATRSAGTPFLFETAALWTFNIATFVALFSILRQPSDIIVVALVHALAIVLAAHGIAAEANGEAVRELGVSLRAYGDFRNPANACVSMLFSALVFLTSVRALGKPRSPLGRIARLVGSATLVAYLIYASSLTGSRAGAGVIVVGVAVYFLLSELKGAAVLMGLVALLCLAIEAVAPGQIERTVADISGTSVLVKRVQKKGVDTDRLYLWRSGLDAFADTYGLGLGMATYPTVHRQYFAQYASKSDARWMDSDLTLHNDAVSALVEFGLVGLCLFLAMCVELARAAKKVVTKAIRPIFYALLIGMVINGFSHTGFAYFSAWFYFALLFAWLRHERRASSAGAPHDSVAPKIGMPRESGLDPRVFSVHEASSLGKPSGS